MKKSKPKKLLSWLRNLIKIAIDELYQAGRIKDEHR